MTSSTSTGEPSSTRGCAFGLDIEADFAIPGLHATRRTTGLHAALRLVDNAEIDRRWRPAEATRISAQGPPHDPERTIDAHPELGYRIHARYFGLCLVAPDGSRLLCEPPPIASWRWQRFLAGRCLPIAAVLRGHEVLHAGAVVVDGGVVAIVGPTGAGKTSLTLQLMLAGERFFTDDVLTLQATGQGLLAHPGVGVLNVRAHEHARLDAAELEALGPLLGRTGRDKLHHLVPVADGPLPLRSLYFLGPGSGRSSATLRPVDAPDPLRLMTSTFIHQVRRPEHLAGLLDVCARLAEDVPMFEIEMGTGEDAASLAARLRAHVSGVAA